MTAEAPAHDVFQAIADPTRREVLRLLSEQEMSLGTICGHFPITRTAVSKHLHILAETRLVRETRVGRETHYRLQPEPLLELKRWLNYYERFWDTRLAALKSLVESGDSDDKDDSESQPD